MSMEKIKYHPLIDCDTSGTEKVPMFFHTDRDTVAAHHSFWLEEIVPHYYRLCARDSCEQELTIHCPICGKIMEAITNPIDSRKRALYACPKCR